MASLNISNNRIGEATEGPLPEGWKSKDDDGEAPWLRIADGHEQDEHPGKVTNELLHSIVSVCKERGIAVEGGDPEDQEEDDE